MPHQTVSGTPYFFCQLRCRGGTSANEARRSWGCAPPLFLCWCPSSMRLLSDCGPNPTLLQRTPRTNLKCGRVPWLKSTSGRHFPGTTCDTRGVPCGSSGSARVLVRCGFDVSKALFVMHEHDLRVSCRDVHGLEHFPCNATVNEPNDIAVLPSYSPRAAPVIPAARSVRAIKCSAPASRQAHCELSGLSTVQRVSKQPADA